MIFPRRSARRHPSLIAETMIHVARDTDSGVEAFCGLVNVFAVYPHQVSEYAAEDLCPECTEGSAAT